MKHIFTANFKILFFLALTYGFALSNAYGQTVLYSETFGTADLTNNCPNWHTQFSRISVGSDDYFEVVSGLMKGNNLDVEAVWYSEVIDISAQTDITLSAYFKFTNGKTAVDYIKAYYKINGGAEQIWFDGTDDTWAAGTKSSASGLTGNTIQIVIRTLTNGNSDSYEFDDVVVSDATNGTIYSESFGTNTLTSDCPSWWTSYWKSATPWYFKTTGGAMEGKNVDVEAVWTSSVVDISCLGTITVSADFGSCAGCMNSSEYIKAYYVLDGGAQTLWFDGTDDTWTAGTKSITGLTGNSLKIIVKVLNTGSTDTYTFDNVTITREYDCGVGGTSSGPASVCTGNTAALSLSGYGGTIQWQQNVNGGGWNNIVGATSSTYTTGALTAGNTYQYRAVVTSGCTCSNNSTTTTITVDPTPTVSVAGGDQNVCAATATLAGNTPAAGTGTWTLISGTGTITTPSSPTSGLTALGIGANTFRWTIANGACTSSTDDVIITNNTATGGTAAATSNCGTTSSLSLSGENGTIQWQQNVNGGGWNNIAGATTDPYTATLVFANSYDFRASVTTACGTVTSTTASIAAGGGATNYTFGGSPSVALSTPKGLCTATYTFTQSTTAARGSGIDAGVTVTVNFMAGTDATTMTSGTFNGVAINMATVVTTATSVTFTTPTKVDCISTSFTIVLNGITNPPYGSGSGVATVSVPNFSGGTDSYNNYTYTIANQIGHYADWDGNMAPVPNYTTANGNGQCYNNLAAGIYCFDYISPTGTGAAAIGTILDGGTSGCSASNGGFASVGNASSGCASAGSVGTLKLYDGCTYNSSASAKLGSCMTAGNIYTTCVTIACDGMNFCPLIYCAAGSCGNGTLPIELLFFDATLNGGIVELDWATETEVNNDFFTVQKTPDGRVFFDILKVDGAGNSSAVINYNAVDDQPLGGVSYYRLKQTDFDGKYSYSRLVPINMNPFAELEIKYVLGNKEHNQLQYQINSGQSAQPISVEVLDILGKVILTERISFIPDDQILYLDASLLSKGAYLMRVSDGKEVVNKKFIY